MVTPVFATLILIYMGLLKSIRRQYCRYHLLGANSNLIQTDIFFDSL